MKEYTKQVEKRLTKSLEAFVDAHRGEHVVWVTLTTVERDPSIAKKLLWRWKARVRARTEICGIYCLEFDKVQFVHYHLLLSLKGALANEPTEVVSREFWEDWADLGQHNRQAFDLSPANLQNPEWILRYMPKADTASGDTHPDRWQKNLPVAFKDRGLKALWWGAIGRETKPEASLCRFAAPSFPTVSPAEVEVINIKAA